MDMDISYVYAYDESGGGADASRENAPDRCTSSLLDGENPNFYLNCRDWDVGSGEAVGTTGKTGWRLPGEPNATYWGTEDGSGERIPPAWCNCTSSAFNELAKGSPLCAQEAAALGALFVDTPPARPGIGKEYEYEYIDQLGQKRTVSDSWRQYVGWRLPVIAASSSVSPSVLGQLTAGLGGGDITPKGSLGANATHAAEALSPSGVIAEMPRGKVPVADGLGGVETLVTPAYSFAASSIDDISSAVLANQIKVRDGSALPPPAEPLVVGTTSRELEQLFPSATVEVFELDPTALRSSIALTSFWGAAADWPFVRTPESWPAPGDTPAGRVGKGELKGFATVKFREGADATRWSLSGGIGALVQNWWANAVVRSGLHPNASISVAFKPFPYERSASELLRNTGDSEASEDVLSLLVDVAVPLATTFALPLVVSTVVLEKEHKLRALMTMMGLRMRWYFLCEWLWSTLVVFTINMALLVAGVASNLTFISRSTTLFAVLLALWTVCIVAWGMLLSCLHSRLLVATVSTYLLIVVLVLFSVVLNNVVLSGTADAFPTALFLIAPIAYYRGVHLLAQRPYTLAALSPEMRSIFVMLGVDTLLYALLAVRIPPSSRWHIPMVSLPKSPSPLMCCPVFNPCTPAVLSRRRPTPRVWRSPAAPLLPRTSQTPLPQLHGRRRPSSQAAERGTPALGDGCQKSYFRRGRRSKRWSGGGGGSRGTT